MLLEGRSAYKACSHSTVSMWLSLQNTVGLQLFQANSPNCSHTLQQPTQINLRTSHHQPMQNQCGHEVYSVCDIRCQLWPVSCTWKTYLVLHGVVATVQITYWCGSWISRYYFSGEGRSPLSWSQLAFFKLYVGIWAVDNFNIHNCVEKKRMYTTMLSREHYNHQ